MLSEHPRRRSGRLAASAVVLAISLAAGPAIAEAAFVSTTTTNVSGQRTSASTLTLAAPTNNVVTAVCAVASGGRYRLTLTVVSHGTVSSANGYALAIYNTSGSKVAGTDLSQSSSATTPPGTSWKYSVDSLYKVPNTSNSWSSNSPRISVSCPLPLL